MSPALADFRGKVSTAMQTNFLRQFAASLLLIAGAIGLSACEENSVAEDVGKEGVNVREQARTVLEDLRTDLDRGVTPERKEDLLMRCMKALRQLQQANDPQADDFANFCDSLEDTNPNTPAAWDDIRRRLDELVARYRE